MLALARISQKELRSHFMLQLQKYGVVPLVMVRNLLEENEDYENCEAITYVLKYSETRYGIKIPKLNTLEQARQHYREDFYDSGSSGELASINLSTYIDEILESIPKSE